MTINGVATILNPTYFNPQGTDWVEAKPDGGFTMPTKRPYDKPQMTAYAVKDIVEQIGPAQAAGASGTVDTHPFYDSTLQGRSGSKLRR
jgi:hypothetical protein